MENSNVLFVDAESSVLESIKRMLLDQNYRAFFAENADEAQNIIDNNDIDIMFVDITSNNLSGLLESVQVSSPNIVKVVISDVAHLSMIINQIRKFNIYSFMIKPWKKQELFETLESAADYSKYLSLQNKEKENLEQKNIIYQRIINFKDDVGESNKNDINALKTTLFFLATKYEQIINGQVENVNKDLMLRGIYTGCEIFASTYPTLVERFTKADLPANGNVEGFEIISELDDAPFIKNLAIIKECIGKLSSFMLRFLNAHDFKVTYSRIPVEVGADEEQGSKDKLVISFKGCVDAVSRSTVLFLFAFYGDLAKAGGFEVEFNKETNADYIDAKVIF